MPTQARWLSRTSLPVAVRFPVFVVFTGVVVLAALWATRPTSVGTPPPILASVSTDASANEIPVHIMPPRAASSPTVVSPDPVATAASAVQPPPIPLAEHSHEAALAPAKPAVAPQPAQPRPMFDNRPIRAARTIRLLVTGYSPDARSCGKSADGFTASGYSVWTNGMKMAAADTRILPFNTLVAVPGYNNGKPIPVYDRGGAIKGNRLDLLFPTHEQARAWGKKTLVVTVWEYAD